MDTVQIVQDGEVIREFAIPGGDKNAYSSYDSVNDCLIYVVYGVAITGPSLKSIVGSFEIHDIKSIFRG